MCSPLTVLILLASITLVAPAIARDSGTDGASPAPPPSEYRLLLRLAFGFYRAFISPQDIASCGFSPSCSRFAQEAIGRHGLQGLLMASDRLQRCHDCGAHLYHRDPATGLAPDPVKANLLGDGQTAGAPPVTSNVIDDAAPVIRNSHDGVDYYSAPALAAFAQHLAHHGDHYRAAGEYQRLLFLLPPGDPQRPLVRWELARNLRLGGDPQRAEFHLDQLLLEPISGAMAPRIRLELAFCDLDRGFYASARSRCLLHSQQRDIVACSYLLEGRWREAAAALEPDSVKGQEVRSPSSLALRRVALDGLAAPSRSEALAGIMSAVIPGSGKIYAGRRADGLFSFLAISFCTWQAIDGFDRNGSRSTKGWFFAGIATGYHAGNIYGSVLAARIHNRSIELELKTRGRNVLLGMSCSH